MNIVNIVKIVFQIAIVVSAFYFLCYNLEWNSLVDALKRIDVLFTLLVIIFSFISYILIGYRWYKINNGSLSFKHSVGITFMAMSFNNILFAKVGELYKLNYTVKRTLYNLKTMIKHVFFEKLMDVIILGVMLLGFILYFNISIITFYIILFCIFIIFLLLHYTNIFDSFFNQIDKILSKFGYDLKANTMISSFNFKYILYLFIISVFIWIFYALITVLFLQFCVDYNINFTIACLVFVAAAAAQAIPSLPSGIGVFEAAVVFVLLHFGFNKEEALALAIVLHMIQIIPTTLIGLFFYYIRRYL